MITKFSKLRNHISVGIVFEYDDKILLVHNTNSGTWSYPKGHIENNEDFKEAAIREVEEELGIKLPKNFLDNLEKKELDPVIKNKNIKFYFYYRYKLNDQEFEKYFDGLYVLPSYKLQLDEVDEARFVSLKKAKKMLPKKYHGIL